MLRPYSLPPVASFILVVWLLAACSDGTDDGVGTTLASTTTAAATTTTTATTTTVVEESVIAATGDDLVYAIWEEQPLTLDIYAPSESGGAPVVIHFPGGRTTRSRRWSRALSRRRRSYSLCSIH